MNSVLYLLILLLTLAKSKSILKHEIHIEADLDSSSEGRNCKALHLKGEKPQPNFYELPAASKNQERIYIPFTLLTLSNDFDAVSAVKVFVGSGANLNVNNFYTITIGLKGGIAIGKINGAEKTEAVLETSMWSNNGLNNGFYLRLKRKDESYGVALYIGEGDDDDGEPLISFKDVEAPLMDAVTTYGFALMLTKEDHVKTKARSSTIIQIEHACQVKLHNPCVHTIECVDDGTSCVADTNSIHHDQAMCECDDDHILTKTMSSGQQCVWNPIQLGDLCNTTRECIHLDAKCRPSAADPGLKVCQCLLGQVTNNEGHCDEPPDYGHVDLGKLGRKQNWTERNPGRRKWVQWARHPLRNSECFSSTRVSSSTTSPSYPLPWTKTGFKFRILANGVGAIVMKIFYQGTSSLSPIVEIADVKLILNGIQLHVKNVTKTLSNSDNFIPSLNRPSKVTFELELRCLNSHLSSSFDCSFILSNDKSKVTENVGNVFKSLMPPTHLTFQPSEPSTTMTVCLTPLTT